MEKKIYSLKAQKKLANYQLQRFCKGKISIYIYIEFIALSLTARQGYYELDICTNASAQSCFYRLPTSICTAESSFIGNGLQN